MAQNKFTRLIRVDKNGTKIYEDWRCARCGGAGGADKWALTGWTCFECGGSGLRNKPVIYKEYTPEHQAKLDAQRAQEELTAPKGSEYVGNIGDKIEMSVTFWKMSSYKVQAFGGFYDRDEPKMQTKYIYSFIDASGNCLIWNTTASLEYQDAKDHWNQIETGSRVKIKGTIKNHSEYKGIKQTELQRCKVTKEVM